MSLYTELIIIYYLVVFQFRLIAPYWLLGVVVGSLISEFASARIRATIVNLGANKHIILSIISAASLGAASPICMYGTVPLIASLGRKGLPQEFLAAFMVSSILINPNLFVFSFALGVPLAFLRLLLCVLAGITAGLLVRVFFNGRVLFDFAGFNNSEDCRSEKKSFYSFLGSIKRSIRRTAPYFLIGIFLTALFERYFPQEWIAYLFSGNKGLGVLLAASIGVPVYTCGGGTIPLLKAWLDAGMSIGSAAAFMITGPATKLTNLGAVKIILSVKHFSLYIAYNIVFACMAGLLINFLT